MIAVTKPMRGGNSEAFAIPRLNGSARRKTIKPERLSDVKFCLSPARPSRGKLFFCIVDMFDFLLLKNRFLLRSKDLREGA
jgi:hypothetical protein